MWRGFAITVPLFLALVLLAGCGQGDTCLSAAHAPAKGQWVRDVRQEGETIRVETVDGHVWKVPRHPRRIVTTLPGLTETVAFLGAADQVVGISEHCDVPEGIEEPTRISVMPVAYEMLRTLSPDLVLVDRVLLAGELETLARRLPAVLPLESRSLAHLRTSVDLLARVLDTPLARARAAAFSADLDGALEAAKGRGAGQRVLLLAGTEPVYALGRGSLFDDMLAALGAVNLACDLGRASGPFAAELVRVRRPDWILVAAGELPPAVRRRWADLPALRMGHVARIDEDRFVRAGPRTPEALRFLARLLEGEGAR